MGGESVHREGGHKRELVKMLKLQNWSIIKRVYSNKKSQLTNETNIHIMAFYKLEKYLQLLH